MGKPSHYHVYMSKKDDIYGNNGDFRAYTMHHVRWQPPQLLSPFWVQAYVFTIVTSKVAAFYSQIFNCNFNISVFQRATTKNSEGVHKLFDRSAVSNFEFIQFGWRRITVTEERARDMFSGKQPLYSFIIRRWPSGCNSPRLYGLAESKVVTFRKTLNCPYVHLDAGRWNSAYNGSSMPLIQFDEMDPVPQPFLGQVPIVVNALVSGGPWISSAHIEFMERTSNAFLPRVTKVWTNCTPASAAWSLSINWHNSLPSKRKRSPHYGGRCLASWAATIITHIMPHTLVTINIDVLSVRDGRESATPADLSIPRLIIYGPAFGAQKSMARTLFGGSNWEAARIDTHVGPEIRFSKTFPALRHIKDLSQLGIAAPVNRQWRRKLVTQEVQ